MSISSLPIVNQVNVILTHLNFRYGTPYLLSLELPKELTALVWLAGPLSGTLLTDRHSVLT